MPFDGRGYEERSDALDKIDEVIALLATKGKWCQRAMQTWDGRRCLLGAMKAADAERVLVAPVLRAIQEVTGITYRRIEQFNDHPATSHALVLRVLHQARENIRTAAVRREAPTSSIPTLAW